MQPVEKTITGYHTVTCNVQSDAHEAQDRNVGIFFYFVCHLASQLCKKRHVKVMKRSVFHHPFIGHNCWFAEISPR